MAALQNIRDKAGAIVAVVIGLAMLAFIIGDFSGSGQALFAGSKMRVLQVGNESVDIQEYERLINDYSEYIQMTSGQSSFSEAELATIREQVFQRTVSRMMMKPEYEELGLSISSDEVFELVQGSDPHIIVRQLFVNNEGEFDKFFLLQFLASMNLDPTGAQRRLWLNIENDIINYELSQKYNNLLSAGLYVPKFLAKAAYEETNNTFDFSYISYPYSQVADSLVNVSNAEIKQYYTDNIAKYQQLEESRDINYVLFAIEPTEEDKADLKQDVMDLLDEFKSTTDDEAFLSLNSDSYYNTRFWTKDQLPIEVQPLFDAEVGAMTDVYESNESYNVSKLVSIASIPDSIKVGQILIHLHDVNAETPEAMADSVNSIVDRLNKGVSFSSLYEKYSHKDTSTPDGIRGWFEYGDVPDTLFTMAKGNALAIQSSESEVYIVQVMDRARTSHKAVQVANLSKLIEASSKTVQKVYSEVSMVASQIKTAEDFDKVTSENGLSVIPAVRIAANAQSVVGINSSPREMVRWAYQAKVGEVSSVFDMQDSYVIAVLTNIHKKGVVPESEVSYDINRTLIGAKKTEWIKNNIFSQASQDMATIAANVGLPMDTLTEVSFSSYALPYIGLENMVMGTAASMAVNSSKVVEGTNSAFLIQKLNQNSSEQPDNYAIDIARLETTYQTRLAYDPYLALQKIVKLSDQRVKFY